MNVGNIGALALGAVIGFLVHYLVRRDPEPGVKDLGGIVGAILGGVALKALPGPGQLSWYFIGLGIGFFLYWISLMAGREKVKRLREERKPLPLFPFLKK
jgi:uncharacterized membrane protein YeaQ/YmgE (transglycosylase-associated protein family)